METEVLQKLAAASTPEEVQACLDEAGMKLTPSEKPADPEPPKPEDDEESEKEDKPSGRPRGLDYKIDRAASKNLKNFKPFGKEQPDGG